MKKITMVMAVAALFTAAFTGCANNMCDDDDSEKTVKPVTAEVSAGSAANYLSASNANQVTLVITDEDPDLDELGTILRQYGSNKEITLDLSKTAIEGLCTKELVFKAAVISIELEEMAIGGNDNSSNQESVESYTAFQKCECLKEIIFPKTMYIVECSQLKGCTNLEKIVVPDTARVYLTKNFTTTIETYEVATETDDDEEKLVEKENGNEVETIDYDLFKVKQEPYNIDDVHLVIKEQ